MKYIDEYRDTEQVRSLVRAIRKVVTKPWHIMEICGGQTHAIARYRLEEMLPEKVRLLHGPGCPVCVLPVGRIEMAIDLALSEKVILCTYADTLRVPTSKGQSLFNCRSLGGDVRMVYSPMDAINIAKAKKSSFLLLDLRPPLRPPPLLFK